MPENRDGAVARVTGLRPDAAQSLTRTMSLPVWSPVNSRLSVSGAALEPVHDLDGVLQATVGDQRGESHSGVEEPVDVVEDQESLHPRPLHDEVRRVADPGGLVLVVRRDRAAAHDPAPIARLPSTASRISPPTLSK